MTKEQLFKTGNYLIIALVVAVAAWTVSEVINYKNISQNYADKVYFTVEGKGEAFALPDVAVVSFSLREVGKTTAIAQKMAQAHQQAAFSLIASQRFTLFMFNLCLWMHGCGWQDGATEADPT